MTETITPTYVGTALAGYGLDLDDHDLPATTRLEFVAMVRDELIAAAERTYEAAQLWAEAGDYQAAWRTRELSDDLDMRQANLNYERRRTAPAYANNAEALARHLYGLAWAEVGTALDYDGTRVLGVIADDNYREDDDR